MSFKKNIINYVLGVFIEKAIPFLMLPFFTRFLGSDEYANLVLFLSYNAIFGILIGFSAEAYYVRELLDKEKKDNVLSIPLLFNFSVFVIFFSCSIFLENRIMILASVLSFLQIIFNYCLSYYLAYKKSKSYVLLSMLFSLVSTVLSAIFIYEIPIYESRIAAIVCSIIFTILVFFWKEPIFFLEIKKNIINSLNTTSWVAWSTFISFCFPLAIHQLAFFMKSGFDRVLMESAETSGYLSSYGLAFQLILPLPVIFSAFNKAFIPYIYEELNQNNIIYAKKIVLFSWFFIPIPIISFFVALNIPLWVYVNIFGKEFVNISLFLPYFIAGSFLILPYFLSNFVLFYKRKTKLIAYANIVTGIVHVFVFINLNSIVYIEYLACSYLISQFFLFFIVNLFSLWELHKMGSSHIKNEYI